MWSIREFCQCYRAHCHASVQSACLMWISSKYGNSEGHTQGVCGIADVAFYLYAHFSNRFKALRPSLSPLYMASTFFSLHFGHTHQACNHNLGLSKQAEKHPASVVGKKAFCPHASGIVMLFSLNEGLCSVVLLP